jgi:hypothetical protein
VTICVPGTGTCQTIDHVQVDTGSSGLRILASVLQLSLAQQTDSNGSAMAECTRFVDGSSWGTLRLADIKIAGEVAANQAIQIIGDPAYAVPDGCSGGTLNTQATDFGANGVLGIGPFLQDCGNSCIVADQNNPYYTCAGNQPCALTLNGVPLAQQVSNPVASFATDNNGVIIQLSQVNGTAASVSGSLIFGIGTQGNNSLTNAQTFFVDDLGKLTTTYGGKSLSASFIDSGSNGYFFPNISNIYVCGMQGETTNAKDFYCPKNGTLNLSATMTGTNGTSSVVNFSVANADSLFTGTTIAAAAALAGPSTLVGVGDPNYQGNLTFDWGLPFYYGRTVYTAIEGRNTSGGMGPYFAF